MLQGSVWEVKRHESVTIYLLILFPDEVIFFNTLETRSTADPTKKHYTNKHITAYSLYINPLAFFYVYFIMVAGAVVIIAVLKKS